MPSYFAPMVQHTLEIEEGTILYLVPSAEKNTFLIKGANCGLERFPYDPGTFATHYWPIDTQAVLVNFNDEQRRLVLFPDASACLTTRPLLLSEVKTIFGFNPNEIKATLFNSRVMQEFRDKWKQGIVLNEIAVQQQVSRQDDGISREDLIQLVRDVCANSQQALQFAKSALDEAQKKHMNPSSLFFESQRAQREKSVKRLWAYNNYCENAFYLFSNEVPRDQIVDILDLEGFNKGELYYDAAALAGLSNATHIPLSEFLDLKPAVRKILCRYSWGVEPIINKARISLKQLTHLYTLHPPLLMDTLRNADCIGSLLSQSSRISLFDVLSFPIVFNLRLDVVVALVEEGEVPFNQLSWLPEAEFYLNHLLIGSECTRALRKGKITLKELALMTMEEHIQASNIGFYGTLRRNTITIAAALYQLSEFSGLEIIIKPEPHNPDAKITVASILQRLNMLELPEGHELIEALRKDLHTALISCETKNTPLADALYHTLLALADSHPVENDDPISYQPVKNARKVMISTGQQFDFFNLIEYHERRHYRGSALGETDKRKWLLNPFTNQKFSSRDEAYLLGIATQNDIKIRDLRVQKEQPEQRIPSTQPLSILPLPTTAGFDVTAIGRTSAAMERYWRERADEERRYRQQRGILEERELQGLEGHEQRIHIRVLHIRYFHEFFTRVYWASSSGIPYNSAEDQILTYWSGRDLPMNDYLANLLAFREAVEASRRHETEVLDSAEVYPKALLWMAQRGHIALNELFSLFIPYPAVLIEILNNLNGVTHLVGGANIRLYDLFHFERSIRECLYRHSELAIQLVQQCHIPIEQLSAMAIMDHDTIDLLNNPAWLVALREGHTTLERLSLMTQEELSLVFDAQIAGVRI